MSLIDDDKLKNFSELIKVKRCYNNSFIAALHMGAEYMVFGVVCFTDLKFACEHCWIEMNDGTNYDATYQVSNSKLLGNSEFFSLYKVKFSNYLEIAEEITGTQEMAIDFYDLRRSPATSHLFQNPRIR